MDLSNLMEWARKWQLRFYADKCEPMSITHTREKSITQYMLDKPLKDVKSFRDLGVTISKDLSWDNHAYYIAESVFAMRLVNLRSVTCYTDQNFKEKAHFGALNLFTSEKRLKLSYKTSINLEDLDFDFVLQHFKLCSFVNEGYEETNS